MKAASFFSLRVENSVTEIGNEMKDYFLCLFQIFAIPYCDKHENQKNLCYERLSDWFLNIASRRLVYILVQNRAWG